MFYHDGMTIALPLGIETRWTIEPRLPNVLRVRHTSDTLTGL
jgi:hypothetical protein